MSTPTPSNRFKDTLIDEVPYEAMPYELLLHQEAQGDKKATIEMQRRAHESVEKKLQERLNHENGADGSSANL